jgi:hypothetical protein
LTWAPENFHTVVQLSTEILNFCWATTIAILGSLASNCSKNTKLCPWPLNLPQVTEYPEKITESATSHWVPRENHWTCHKSLSTKRKSLNMPQVTEYPEKITEPATSHWVPRENHWTCHKSLSTKRKSLNLPQVTEKIPHISPLEGNQTLMVIGNNYI